MNQRTPIFSLSSPYFIIHFVFSSFFWIWGNLVFFCRCCPNNVMRARVLLRNVLVTQFIYPSRVFFCFCYGLQVFLSAFSIRIRHPHLPSAGIRSSFYRRPNRIIHWKTIQFRFTGSFHIKKKELSKKKKLYAYLSRLSTFLKIFSFIKATSNLIRWASL